MKPGMLLLTGILLPVLVSAVCWLDLAPSRADRTPPSHRALASWGELTAALPSARQTVRIPNPLLALATLSTHARTSLLGVRHGATQPLIGPEVMDAGSTVLRGSALAYLLLPGLDPSQNYIEAHDLDRDLAWEIRPEQGGVIFGFAVQPDGSQLAYLEVDGRPSGTQPPWRVIAVDLGNGTRRAILDGARDGSIALLPVDWESSTILLRGLTPFSPQFHGLWSVQSDGSGLRKLLDEFDFVGTPRLSAQGDRLAVLTAQPGVRPPRSSPGEPTATGIEIHELDPPRRLPILVTDGRHEFTHLLWGAGNLLAVEGDWDQDRQSFVHRRVLRVAFEDRSAPDVVRFAVEGEILQLAGCPNGSWLAGVQAHDSIRLVRENEPQPIAILQPGNLDNLTCLADTP